ncbi:DUF3793 family protein [Lachnospiraceae bacterium 54-53]
MSLERHLIEYCSPTLASIKTASLFNHSFSSEEELEKQLTDLNSQLGEKGIMLLSLYRRRNKALIYVYRKSHLQADLNRPGVSRFLKKYGYERMEADYALERLKKRLGEDGAFPHEIGIFLGYPLGDVIGFIQNSGKNCKCIGCWKVYCNECEAVRIFARYQKCRAVYSRLWQNGRSVWQLTVAA